MSTRPEGFDFLLGADVGIDQFAQMRPVWEMLPPVRGEVLVYTQDEEFIVACYIPEAGDQERAQREGHLRGITHWCHLPDKPAKAG